MPLVELSRNKKVSHQEYFVAGVRDSSEATRHTVDTPLEIVNPERLFANNVRVHRGKGGWQILKNTDKWALKSQDGFVYTYILIFHTTFDN